MKRAISILAACLMAWIAMPQVLDAQNLHDARNQQVGKATSVKREHAAAFFFFK